MKTEKRDDDAARQHAARIGEVLDDVITYLREVVDKIDDRGGRVLFETAADVISGVRTALAHYERRSEAAAR